MPLLTSVVNIPCIFDRPKTNKDKNMAAPKTPVSANNCKYVLWAFRLDTSTPLSEKLKLCE